MKKYDEVSTITNAELRLRLGELTAEECRIARAAYHLGFHQAELYQGVKFVMEDSEKGGEQ